MASWKQSFRFAFGTNPFFRGELRFGGEGPLNLCRVTNQNNNTEKWRYIQIVFEGDVIRRKEARLLK